MKSRKNGFSKGVTVAASTALIFGLLTVGVNTSPVLAQNLGEAPVVGKIVKVLTFREYKIDEEKFAADIKVPEIKGLENKDLENGLNEKYLEENKKLYADFIKEMEDLKKQNGGNIAVDSGYEVKTDNEKIFSVSRYITQIAASATTTLNHDTIDKQKQILLTLPSLFKDEGYVEVISKNIISQMRDQMKKDEGKVYWTKEQVDESLDMDYFKKIKKDQDFYINPEGKLVISFNEYEVAPGYMGTVEFVIPTKAIQDVLVGNEYIK
ncbi:protein of unknown function [Desulfonispora thiosulfatigenes DSM 11270]|uniref:DUF3298 domain-containing protein n=1 Tax=Desulfonispora thiosulfatigenes DSM 11270 TaxID=656914 RepID=A0A1W1UY07_DESTI|nr:DUF3298 and DUF4163 domain-containing protein [Desulfonispora thiosulfatigenes]SMB85860.1 protein of unknown function [Desulfonispora thiosulfatigenes DSM 11270]